MGRDPSQSRIHHNGKDSWYRAQGRMGKYDSPTKNENREATKQIRNEILLNQV